MAERTQPTRSGRRLGEFIVGERLGRGGFADVYQASQPSLGRAAVIKILRGTPAPLQVRRFEQEARMACQLDHPYAAHVYAFGVEPDGVMWIAMELVRGISLAEWLETKGPISLGRFVGLFERLCEVVHTAHQAGLVHRDIKPANVMVVTRAGKLMPKLLDFGIATDSDNLVTAGAPAATAAVPLDDSGSLEDSTDPTRSEERHASGTPAYMAPEQWGTRHDHRVDIYALGVLAFRCLTGRAPIIGKTPRELYLAHRQQPVPGLGEAFPADLDGVLGTALAKDPDARYRSALELATAFSNAASNDTSFLSRDEVRRWLTTAPPHLAACVSAVASSRSLSDALEASRRLCDALAQWLGVLALAASASLGAYAGDLPQIVELRRNPLGSRDWLELALALSTPYAERDEDFPIPEMVRWFVDEAGSETVLAAIAATRPDAATFPRDLIGRVLHGLRFIAGYTLISGGDEWTSGTRAVEKAGVYVSDGDGNPLFELSPLVVAAAPAPGEHPELFAIAGGGRTGARQIAYPQGFERESDAVWPWLETHFAITRDKRGTTIADRAPYRGLAPFSTADADLFFGRARAVEQLFNRMLDQPFVALTGPSGSGKSSLVFAGLVPRLPDGWIAITLRPGRRPVAALDAALVEAGFADVAGIVPSLRTTGQRLLLVIDQAEELLTLASASERSQFAAALAHLVASGGDRVRAIVTLRHDFIGRADELPEWRELIQHNLLLVTVPNTDELAEMITNPAMQVGYDFDDPLLVRDMIAEVADRPGALPLLSFAASRLWDARDLRTHQMTRAAYVAMGGVGGALARYAEDTFTALSPRQQGLARELLRRLITAEGTSAPARSDDLATIGEGASAVLEALIAARILVATERPDGGEDVAVVHEALIDRWPRLVGWRADDAAGARHLDELRAAATLWAERGRETSYLWRGDALAIYRQWTPRWRGSLTASESAFGEAGLRAEARARRRRHSTIALAITALATAIAVLVLLYRRADHSRDEAEERFTDMLLDRGRSELLADHPLRALVYLSAAYQRGRDGPGIRVALGMASRTMDREIARVRAHKSMAAIDTTPDDFVLTSASNEPARSWQLRDGRLQPIATYQRPDGPDQVINDLAMGGGMVGSIGFHKPLVVWEPDGKRRAVGKDPGAVYLMNRINVGRDMIATQWDNDVALWDRDAQWLGVLTHPRRPKGTDATKLVALSFAKDTPRLVIAFAPGSVEMWNTTDQTLAWQTTLDEPLTGAVFAGEQVVVGTSSGSFVVLSASGKILFRQQAHSTLWTFVSRDNKTLATVGMEAQIKLWSLVDGHQEATLTERSMHPNLASVSPDGRLLVAAHESIMALWDIKTRVRLGTIDVGRSLGGFTFSSDSKTLITTDSVGWVKTWDLRPDHLASVFAEQRAEIFSASFAPDGETISTFAGDTTIRQWRARDGIPTSTLTLKYDELMLPTLQRIAYLPDGRLLAPYRGHLGVWDVARATSVGLFPLSLATYTAAVGPDNRIGVANAIKLPDFHLMVWDADRQQLLAHHQIEDAARDLAFDPSGKRLAFVTSKHVGIWDIEADRILWTAEVPNAYAADLDFSRDGRYVTASADDGYARIWYAESGELARSIKQPGRAMSVAFSPDTGLLATANTDHNVYLWDVATGDLAGPLVGHTHVINGIVFSPDGTRLVSFSRDQHALVWTIPYERRTPAALAKAIAERVPFRLVGAELVESDQ